MAVAFGPTHGRGSCRGSPGAGGLRRPAPDRLRPDQLPAADRGRHAAAARRTTGAAGARRRCRVGLDDGAAGPPGGTVRRGGRGRAGAASLVTFGSANLARTGQPWASIRVADPGVLGWPDGAPYDRVLVSAEPRRLPDELVEQVADGGVMVIPVAGDMLRVTNPGAGEPVTAATGSCPSAEAPPRGVPPRRAAPAGRPAPGRAHRLVVRPDDREDPRPDVVGDHARAPRRRRWSLTLSSQLSSVMSSASATVAATSLSRWPRPRRADRGAGRRRADRAPRPPRRRPAGPAGRAPPPSGSWRSARTSTWPAPARRWRARQTTASAPAATWRSAPAPVEPCSSTRSPCRASSIGTAHGRPSVVTVASVRHQHLVEQPVELRALGERRSFLAGQVVQGHAPMVAGPRTGFVRESEGSCRKHAAHTHGSPGRPGNPAARPPASVRLRQPQGVHRRRS